MDYSNSSAVIIGERCTSTPENSHQRSLSFIDLSPSISDTIRDRKKRNSVLELDPQVNFAPIPIFGRSRLLELSEAVKNGGTLICKNINKIKIDYTSSKNIHSTQNLLKKVNTKENVATIKSISNIDKVKKKSVSSKKRKSLPTTKVIKRRSNNYNEYLKATLQVKSKIPKSPRLLTALRAQLRRNNQDQTKQDQVNSKIPVKQATNIINNKIQQRKEEVKAYSHSTDIKMTKIETKKPIIHFSRNNNSSTNNQKKRENGIERRTIFKAHPIRKYAPLPVIPKRPLTVPESPKIGKRYKLNHILR